MVKNKTVKDGWDENISLAEHDRIFKIDSETRKQLNNPKGWITNTDKPVFGRKKVEKLNKTNSKKQKVKKEVVTEPSNEVGTVGAGVIGNV